MGNELSRTSDIIIDIFIDDDYKINNELEWTDVIQDYIMRYRRIIGIIILVILLGIMQNCNWNKSNLKIKTTTNNEKIWVGKGGAFLAEVPIASALDSGGAAALASGAGASALDSSGAALASGAGESVAGSGSGAAAANLASGAGASVAGSGGAAALVRTAGQSIGSNVAQNLVKDAMSNTSGSKIPKGTIAQYKAMRAAGMSKFGAGLQFGKQAGQYGVDKFKEFASWLYEILFAIAISIAICMIVVPSIAFFALGLICYFLLRKKLITMKAF